MVPVERQHSAWHIVSVAFSIGIISEDPCFECIFI